MALAERQEAILKTIIEEYVVVANPVASKTIAYNHDLKVSPATVRNDVAYLEEHGYVMRPHLSAGTIPTDKAYRHYVERLGPDVEPSPIDEHLVSKLFQEAMAAEMEQWLRIAAVLLARLVHNLAVVTQPKAPLCRFKHLDLVAMQGFLAMLILVLCEAKVRQTILSFDREVSQDELTVLANKLNSTYSNLTSSEISVQRLQARPDEKQVSECVVDMMSTEDRLRLGRPHLEGLHLMLSQPEFSNSPRRLDLLELLEKEDWLETAFGLQTDKGKIRVIIGEENSSQTFQDLSLVIGEYGVQDKAKGIVAVIGPKRMDYGRAISSVDSLSSLLSESMATYI